MSASTDALLLDFVDPLKAALDLVKRERLNTEVACLLNPSLSRKEIENFQRAMWQRNQVSSVIDQYLALARSRRPPAIIYVETAEEERVGFAGERLLDDAWLMGVPGELVLCVDGSNYAVVDVSPALTPLPPGLVLNPAFVRWREMAMAWEQEHSRRTLEFLCASDLLRRDFAGYTISIKADSTAAADEQAEPIDDRANRPGMTSGSAPATDVASYLTSGERIAGHMRVRVPYLAWLREQSHPRSYKERLNKLTELALADGWREPGPALSTLREWEMRLRQEFLRKT